MNILLAAVLGSVAIIYEDAYFDGRPDTRQDVAAYAATSIPYHQCEELARRLRAVGGFVHCFKETDR